MSHAIKIKAYIYRYCGSVASIKEESPTYAMWTYKTTNSDWVLVKEITVEDTDDTTNDEVVQKTVEAIDKSILEKRMDLEKDLVDLHRRKQDLLSLTFEA